MLQPAPFSTTRREKARERNGEMLSLILSWDISMLLPEIGFNKFAAGRLFGLRRRRGCGRRGLLDAAVEELRALHNGLHQGAEFVAVRRQIGVHLVHQGLIGQLRRARWEERRV